jgi:uncharacterized protein (TIGR02099 family)
MPRQNPTVIRHRRRVLRMTLLAVVGTLTIGWALVLAAVGALLPWVVTHPERIAKEMSERLGRPVSFERIDARWEAAGPVFTLDGLAIGKGSNAFRVPRGEWVLDFYAWLRRGASFSEIRIGGLALELLRDGDAGWRVRGLGQGPAPVDLDQVLGLTAVTIDAATLRVIDHANGIDWQLSRIDAKVRNEAGAQVVGLTAWASETAPPLRLACMRETGGSRRQCFVKGESLVASDWLQGLPGLGLTASAGQMDLRAWIEAGDQLESLRVLLSGRRLALRAIEAAELSDGARAWAWSARERLELDLRFVRGDVGWQVDATQRTGAGESGLDGQMRWIRRIEGTAVEDHVIASRIDLDLAGALAAMSGADARLRGALLEARPRGRLRDLDFRRQAGGEFRLAARVDQLIVDSGARAPGMGPVSGMLLADESGASLTLAPGSDWTLTFPYMFREPIRARVQSGSLAAWPGVEGRWHVGAADLGLAGEGWAATINGELTPAAEQTPPILDVRAEVHHGKVERARLFWPINVMPAPAVAWLDRALVGGDVGSAAVIFRGELRRGTLRDGGARLDAVAELRDTTLDYTPGWPVATIDTAQLRFIDMGMSIDELSGTIRENRVEAATASISDFRDARLVVEVQRATGSGENLLGFLRDSPLNRRFGPPMQGVELGGRGEVSLRLERPLKRGAIGGLDLIGEARLIEASLVDRARRLDFGTTDGRVRFSDAGFVTDDLNVRFGGEPATLALAIGEYVADPRHVAEASLRGELSAAALLERFPEALPWAQRLPGRAQWDVTLAIDSAAVAGGVDGEVPARAPDRQVLRLRSDLVGIAMELPAPLRKDAASPLPFALDLPMAPESVAEITLGRLGKGQLRLPEGGRGLAIVAALGLAEVPALPVRGVVVRGDAAAVDGGGWIDLVTSLPDSPVPGPPLPFDIDVVASELALIGRGFPDTRIEVERDSERIGISFDGPALVGTVALPNKDVGPPRMSLDFDRLYLLDRVASPDAKPPNPAALPSLAIRARDFRMGDARLGSVEIETSPIEGGLVVERLAAVSPQLSLSGSGRWTGTGEGEQSDFDIELAADSLGNMLDALGFVGIVDGGKTRARLSGQWPGGPADLKLANMSGELEARVEEGRILEVEPGAGRILGLVSLVEIPRRLALDFSDFFQRGMAFDSIEGRFRLEKGDAWTDSIAISSPAADIVIKGRTGLATRDYDQWLVVTPRMGSVLPLVGALAAGPAGVAVGAVAQGILGQGMGRMAESNYRITGSWDSPEITKQRAVRPSEPQS